jgi:hypothetical protein
MAWTHSCTVAHIVLDNCADDFDPISLVMQQTKIYYDVRTNIGVTTTWE